MTTSQVRVGVRIRPLSHKEHSQGAKYVVESRPPSASIGSRSFTFDNVFDKSVSQESLFNEISPPLLKSFVEGYNATIMAYGQTGSGKTFTMGSEANSEGDAGLITRFMKSIFECLRDKKLESDTNDSGPILLTYSVNASFLEVYGEDVHDLLDQDRKTLPLRDDSKGGVVATGLITKAISSAEEALDVLKSGTLNRTTAATLMNLTSSRSHAVFTIYLSQTIKTEIEATTTSKFTFVDLAGSERMKKTGAEGERAREGIKINEGLLALGNVINALADENRLLKEQKIHVPYRQSKLTRLLQDALGGNSQTLFIACVSPADVNASEILSTLRYANRARNIKNAPTKNIDASTLELQRLHALNALCISELLQYKFGILKDNLNDEIERSEVKEYLNGLKKIAEKDGDFQATLSKLTYAACSTTKTQLGRAQEKTTMPVSSRTPLCPNTAEACPSSTTKDEVSDENILEEINPEEELAILDQLLELQQKDQDFNKEHKEGQEELEKVEGELEEQETMLLQLRESLMIYHNMKDKYEMLMTEVQTLEVEKTSLADQLQKVSIDPTKGCSQVIKKKLEKVESNLLRARSETRKHQQKYRQVEQQAKKCKALEQKITNLKQGKIAMIKKQKEAAARHREYTETKTRELLVLKKKERNADKKATKLQTEILIYKKNLAKRKEYSQKVTSKLKETERHLMKLLAMRQRELKQRMKRQPKHESAQPSTSEQYSGYNSVELESIRLLLSRTITDRVNKMQTRIRYEKRVGDYSELMRRIVGEVRLLDGNDNEGGNHEVVEELELQLEIVSKELESLRSQLGKLENKKEISLLERQVQTTVKNLDNKASTILLWEFIEKFTTAELEKQGQAKSMEKKDSIIESLQTELSASNQKVMVLSKEIAERHKFSADEEDPLQIIRCLRRESAGLRDELVENRPILKESKQKVMSLQQNIVSIERDLQEAKEKLALSEVISRQKNDKHWSQSCLEVLQKLWSRIGASNDEREKGRLSIASCLEDTCQRYVDEVQMQKKGMEQEIESLRISKESMQDALGRAKTVKDSDFEDGSFTLIEERDHLQKQVNAIKPEFDAVLNRRNHLVEGVKKMMTSLEITKKSLSIDLMVLLGTDEIDNLSDSQLKEQSEGQLMEKESQLPLTGKKRRAAIMKDVADILQSLEESKDALLPNGTLDSAFLEQCEKSLTKLRIEKARKIANNSDRRTNAHNLAKDMHMETEDLSTLLEASLTHPIPEWWEKNMAMQVLSTVVNVDGVVGVSNTFSDHLKHLETVLHSVSRHRLGLSAALKEIIGLAQRTLLSAVGEEVDASAAYTSFHEALFNLPSLSKEHINTCIEEINALTDGVGAMTQSEIEALTVIWEALGVPITERSFFWGEIDEASKSLHSKETAIFESLKVDSDEEWIITASEEARKANVLLSTRLCKLERVHKEVDRLRSKQDAKSRIISLDSEIRILSATLAEFEEKKCNKERLLTKKAGSATLLREGRFRKQMQGKYVVKLQQLASAIKSWKSDGGSDFHDDNENLSEEVKVLLNSPDDIDTLVKKRTAFMHLRTVQRSRLAGKRIAPYNTPATSVKKKKRPEGDIFNAGKERRVLSSLKRPSKIAKSLSAHERDSETSPVERQRTQIVKIPKSDTKYISKSPTKFSGRIRKEQMIFKKLAPSPHNEAKHKTKTPTKHLAKSRKEQRSPFSPNHQFCQNMSNNLEASIRSKKSKRDTLMPFSNVLGDVSPHENLKENFPKIERIIQ